MSKVLDELSNDVVEDFVENKEQEIVEENKEIKDEPSTEISEEKEVVNEEVVNEEKEIVHEDIYVENDIGSLERMLGVPASEEDDEEGEEQEDELSHNDDLNSSDEETEKEENKDNYDVEEVEDVEEKEEEKHIVLLSDFMDEVEDSFTYLTHSAGSFTLHSIPINSRREIKLAVKSPSYVFRYPKYVLRDNALGFEESPTEEGYMIHYRVYFPDYILSFDVPSEHKKPYPLSFKDYFEDLVTRIRPLNMALEKLNDAVSINSIKVIETGIIEVISNGNMERYLLSNPHISFFDVLAYIRDLSDHGEDTLVLKLIPAYFSRV